METMTMQTKELEKEVNGVTQYASDLEIRTQDDSLGAQGILKEIKSREKKVEQFFSEMKQTTYDAWKSVVAKEKAFLDPLATAERTIKNKVVSFENEAQKKRDEEARIAQAKADAIARKEREALEEKARKAAEKGNTEKAEALREQAETVVAQPVFSNPEPVQAKGTAFKKTWIAEVTDLPMLLKSISEGRAPLGIISINQSALNAYAKGTKGTMQVPGLKFSERTDMAVRA
jgi:uncharacterized protein YdiU (UPF0061 family)